MLDIYIGVQSKIRKGSLFWLEIPAQFQTETVRTKNAARLPEHGKILKEGQEDDDRRQHALILIIDDNELNLELLGSIFENERYTVLTSISGKEGIRMARQHQPDIVIMDLAMPDMDGIEATQAIKRDPITADIPVIACSALVSTDMREQAFEAGCEGYIPKPVDPQYLVKQVARHLETYRVS
jgi:two-component system cell cycle response regulator DivK